MRPLTTVATILFLTITALAQSHGEVNKEVGEQLQKLITELNDAIVKKDRPRLERLYADEFQFIHGNGYIIIKSAQIDGIMANNPLSSTPLPVPSFDNLLLYGDVAIFRNPTPVLGAVTVFVKKKGQWQLFQHRAHVSHLRETPSKSILNFWIHSWAGMSLGQARWRRLRERAMF